MNRRGHSLVNMACRTEGGVSNQEFANKIELLDECGRHRDRARRLYTHPQPRWTAFAARLRSDLLTRVRIYESINFLPQTLFERRYT
jgi:hypothetical protein